MLVCKSSPASAFLGAWTEGDEMEGDEILLRTKFDLDAHEERYEYLTETLGEGIAGGEFESAVYRERGPLGLAQKRICGSSFRFIL